MVGPAVELLLTGAILGFICSPITNSLSRHRVPRALAAFLALLLVLAIIAGVAVLLGCAVLRQLVVLLPHVPGSFAQIHDFPHYFLAPYGHL